MALQNRTPTGQEKTAHFAHSAATVAKVPCLVNGRVAIPLNTADANVLNAYFIGAQISDAPKAAGAAWSVFDPLYWDDAAKAFTKTSAGNTLCGYALAAAATTDVVSGLIAFDTFAK